MDLSRDLSMGRKDCVMVIANGNVIQNVIIYLKLVRVMVMVNAKFRKGILVK